MIPHTLPELFRLIAAVIGFMGGPIIFFLALTEHRQQEKLASMPLSSARAAPFGPAKLSGKAEFGADVTAPLSGRKCCAWRVTYAVNYGGWGYQNIVGQSLDLFFLMDDSGNIRVDPADSLWDRSLGKKIPPSEYPALASKLSSLGIDARSARWRNGQVIEYIVDYGMPLMVIGELSTVNGQRAIRNGIDCPLRLFNRQAVKLDFAHRPMPPWLESIIGVLFLAGGIGLVRRAQWHTPLIVGLIGLGLLWWFGMRWYEQRTLGIIN